MYSSKWIYLVLHVTLIKYGSTSFEETFGISNSEKKQKELSGFADHILNYKPIITNYQSITTN